MHTRQLRGALWCLLVTTSACTGSSGDINDLLDELGELSEPQDSFEDGLIILGGKAAPSGARTLYVQGSDNGKALSAKDFAELQVWVDGTLVHGCAPKEPSSSDSDANVESSSDESSAAGNETQATTGSVDIDADAGNTEVSTDEVGTEGAGSSDPDGADLGSSDLGSTDVGSTVVHSSDAGVDAGEVDAGSEHVDASSVEAGASSDSDAQAAESDDGDAGVEDTSDAGLTLLDASFQLVEPGDEQHCVELAGLEIRGLAELSEPVFSLSIVNDYSGSMADDDIERVADIHDMLFRALPNVYEAEVVFFGTDVETRLPFTSNRSDVLNAVRADLDYERSLTSLYDGMGVSLQSLLERDLPVRILMVSSDGLENDSDEWTKSQLLEVLDEGDVFTIMLGSNLADVGEMRDFTRKRGVFFYTPALSELGTRVSEYVQSLVNSVEVTLPPELQDENVELRLGDARVKD